MNSSQISNTRYNNEIQLLNKNLLNKVDNITNLIPFETEQ